MWMVPPKSSWFPSYESFKSVLRYLKDAGQECVVPPVSGRSASSSRVDDAPLRVASSGSCSSALFPFQLLNPVISTVRPAELRPILILGMRMNCLPSSVCRPAAGTVCHSKAPPPVFIPELPKSDVGW